MKIAFRPLIASKNWVIKHKAIFFTGTFILILLLTTVYYFWPRPVNYSFSGQSCIQRITILPSTYKTTDNEFNYSYKEKIRFFGKDIIARSVCFNLANMVEERSLVNLKLYPFDLKLLAQSYVIKVPQYPTLKMEDINLEAVPLAEDLVFPLNKADNLFQYQLTINDSTVFCLSDLTSLKCSTNNLNLKHNTNYQADIERLFNEQIKPVVSLEIKTVEPVKIIDSSVKNQQQIITKLDEIKLTADRPITKIDGLKFESRGEEIDVKSSIDNNNISLDLPNDLARGEDYKLTIQQLHGQNNETLVEPYTISFRLEKGPSVASSSLPDRALQASADLILYFSQNVAEADYRNLIKLYQNSKSVDFSYYVSGNKIVINPQSNFDRCASIKLEFSGQINNVHGVANDVGWSTTSRALCATSFSIGKSSAGRPIIGYSYGGGSREVLYVAALHGDEYNSKRVLEEWMWELEGNPSKIPAGTKVTVVPSLNPDGIYLRTRYNANGIDLNRNFPANNWKSDIVIKGGETLEGGGGVEPLSEPESRVIANYIQSRWPSLILTYHSQGGIVESNESGDANALAQKYANLSGYGFKLASQNADFFEYDINGSLEEWAHDKMGLPVILIELSTKIYHDFSRNKDAMWAML